MGRKSTLTGHRKGTLQTRARLFGQSLAEARLPRRTLLGSLLNRGKGSFLLNTSSPAKIVHITHVAILPLMPLCRWERRGKGADCEKAKSKTARAPPLRQAGGVCTCSYGAGVDEPRSLSGGGQRSGGGGHRSSGNPGACGEAG